MPPTDAPTWWADVQQEREDLAGAGAVRHADDWLGEDIDFVPRRRMTGDRAAATSAAARRDDEHDLHGVFIPSPAASAAARGRTTVPAAGSSVIIELDASTPAPVRVASDALTHALGRLSAADDPFASPPPPSGARRTIQVEGRPGEGTVTSMARRHRPRTASDRVGPRPDRIALWVVVLGAILILLAATSSSSQAATAAVPAASASQVLVVAPPAPGAVPVLA